MLLIRSCGALLSSLLITGWTVSIARAEGSNLHPGQFALQQAICFQEWREALNLSAFLIGSSQISQSYRHYLIELRPLLYEYRDHNVRLPSMPECHRPTPALVGGEVRILPRSQGDVYAALLPIDARTRWANLRAGTYRVSSPLDFEAAIQSITTLQPFYSGQATGGSSASASSSTGSIGTASSNP
jgi:hypothetical protein